ncbi:MAG: DUF3606 domain-containing protein [Pseudomonadota bacterium]|nr:DUF3606 domain-containing protein [Pseudomonadota bacterium]
MNQPPASSIHLDDAEQVQRWLDHFGVTAEQLQEAVQAVGSDPQAVTEHLLHQGASAGLAERQRDAAHTRTHRLRAATGWTTETPRPHGLSADGVDEQASRTTSQHLNT